MSTYMRAANLMIDAYPELIHVFAPITIQEGQ